MNTKHLLDLPARVVAYLEDEKIPFLNYIATFFSVIILRQFFETYYQEYNVFDLKPGLNIDVWYVCASFLAMLLVLSIWAAYLVNAKIFMILVRDLRVPRIIYYELTLLFGAAFAFSIQRADISATLIASPGIVIEVILSMISIFFAAVFSLMVNNINDIKIDKVSNPSRPLAAGVVDLYTYQWIAYSMMGVALFYASLVNAKALLNIAVIMSAYYIYSAVPLRLKRIPVLSKLIISFNSFVLVLLGYLLVQGNMQGFPNQLMWIYFVGLTIAANFIDLKDIAGDRAGGVVTLPMLLGERAAKIMIGAGGFLVCLSSYFVIPDTRLIPVLVIDGAIFFYLINKNDYSDRQVMLFCNVNLLVMILYLLMAK